MTHGSDISTLLGWTPDQWQAARMWAEKNGLPRPPRILPTLTELEAPQGFDLEPWYRLQIDWRTRKGDGEPSLCAVMAGFEP